MIADEMLEKVWKYIHELPPLFNDTRIEFNYDDHCQKLNISPDDLREMIIEFEQRGLIRREGYYVYIWKKLINKIVNNSRKNTTIV